ncbi:serine/threonine protein kinase, partial [Streptomyces beijiangensis]|nr:serine/threonine protein kinase [Streptomyces beijiangensis]
QGPSGDPTLTVRRALPRPGSAPAPAPPRGPRIPRRALVTAALAAVAAVTVVAVLMNQSPSGNPSGQGSTSSAPTVAGTSRPPSTSAPASASGSPSLAPGAREEAGFVWTPPAGWQRSDKEPPRIYYTSPDKWQEVSATFFPRESGDLLTRWNKIEQSPQRVTDYRKVRLERTTYKGQPAIIWEYTFDMNGSPANARVLGFDAAGRSYKIELWYFPVVKAQSLRTFDRLTASFIPL